MRKFGVRILAGKTYDKESVDRFVARKTKKKGIMKRESLETAIVSSLIWRPFRFVNWLCSDGERTGISLIDESLTVEHLDQDEQILLWRPRYVGLEVKDLEETRTSVSSTMQDKGALKRVIEALVDRRNEAQTIVESLSPEVRKPDAQSAVSMFVPKSPGSLRRRERVADELRVSYSILVGTSLISNISPDTKVIEGVVGDRVYVGTYIAEFQNVESDESRLEILETPGAHTMRTAWASGRALSRLCELNEACRNRIRKRLS